MPFPEVGAFVSKLRELPGVSARCLEFTILTAARTSEAIKAKPEEFDLDSATWTIPASRMKAQKEHRVPLSPRAAEIARTLMELKNDHLFLSPHKRKPISNMAMLDLLDRMEIEVTWRSFTVSWTLEFQR